jgi:DNA-binding response OmpR family regulator
MLATGYVRVLLVDDDESTARPLAELLAVESVFACDVAANVSEANTR